METSDLLQHGIRLIGELSSGRDNKSGHTIYVSNLLSVQQLQHLTKTGWLMRMAKQFG